MKFTGKVIKGEARGSKTGFRTMNLDSKNLNLEDGIYVTMVKIDGTEYESVSSWGGRPTFNENEKVFEIHVFDFDSETYGQEVEVEVFKRIREIEKFASIEALSEKIAEDVRIAKEFFRLRKSA